MTLPVLPWEGVNPLIFYANDTSQHGERVMEWFLPGRAHLGVSVRAGQRGAVVPCIEGGVYVNWQRQEGEAMQVRYPTSDAPLALRITARDLARVAPRGGHVYLTATVYRPDGVTTYQREVFVKYLAPDGLVFALITREGTYWSGEGLGRADVLRVECENGTSYTADSPGDGVTFLPGETRLPARVYATDPEGLISDDVLAGVQVEADSDPTLTSLSAWPLPPYLRAEAPNLRAFLTSFEDVLDVRPEQAGRYLYLQQSSGEPLTLIGKLFSVTREEGTTDEEVIRRTEAALHPAKDSLDGLGHMLRAYGVFGAQVMDMMTETDGRPLFLDGSWMLNGEYYLNGGSSRLGLQAGEVAAVFSRVPSGGLGRAVRVMRAYKAAGIRSRVILRREAYAQMPMVGTRATLTRRCTLLGMQVKVPFLTLDGTWLLDGVQELDGVRNQ